MLRDGLRMLERLAILTVILVGAGCSFGCSSEHTLDDDYHLELFHTKTVGERPIAGFVVKKDARVPGLEIARVLRASPADDAGVRPGDVLLRFGANRVSTADELAGLLKKDGPVQGTSHVELTISRNGERIVIPVNLRTRANYSDIVKERLKGVMNSTESDFEIWGFYYYKRREVDPETWLAYTGQAVKKPVVFYRNIDFTILKILHPFKVESVPVCDTYRAHIICWPIEWTSSGRSEYYFDPIIAAGESGYELY